jgi:NAD(P)-dependent dehydrogenase (short-subunit alcohol dehydrogenase family)
MAKQFGAQSTTDEVLEGVDLSGRRILVTGASAGLGVETLRALAAHGASVIGVARDLAKARGALAKAGVSGVELVEADLASLASVRNATDALLKRGGKLDAIVANAGVMACPEGQTADGFETQFGTNQLGHFVLVNRLVPLLKDPARVVVLSSGGHRFADVDLDDPNFGKTPYDPLLAYGRSKTANVLFAVELDRRLKARGVRVNAVHPGVIQTELARHMTPEIIQKLIPGVRPGSGSRPPSAPGFTFKTIPQGAATSVWSGFTAAADLVGGRYCEDCHVADVTEDPSARTGVRAYAIDPARAAALWAKSEAMVGERFAL